jgi:hypothetical protein
MKEWKKREMEEGGAALLAWYKAELHGFIERQSQTSVLHRASLTAFYRAPKAELHSFILDVRRAGHFDRRGGGGGGGGGWGGGGGGGGGLVGEGVD